jgi:hypothetical protein
MFPSQENLFASVFWALQRNLSMLDTESFMGHVIGKLKAPGFSKDHTSDSALWEVADAIAEALKQQLREEISNSPYVSFSVDTSVAVGNNDYLDVEVSQFQMELGDPKHPALKLLLTLPHSLPPFVPALMCPEPSSRLGVSLEGVVFFKISLFTCTLSFPAVFFQPSHNVASIPVCCTPNWSCLYAALILLVLWSGSVTTNVLFSCPAGVRRQHADAARLPLCAAGGCWAQHLSCGAEAAGHRRPRQVAGPGPQQATAAAGGCRSRWLQRHAGRK